MTRKDIATVVAAALTVWLAGISSGSAQSREPIPLSGAPKLIKSSRAGLSLAAQRAGIEGAVLVRVVADASGHVLDARIEKSSHPLLAKPPLDEAKEWLFEPTYREGRAVSVSFPIVVGYSHELQQPDDGRVRLYAGGEPGRRFSFDIPRERVAALPRWNLSTLDEPSLTKVDSLTIGRAWIASHRPNWHLRSTATSLRHVDLQPSTRVWLYVVQFSTDTIDAGTATADDIDFPLVAIVLLDGTVVEPDSESGL